MRRKWDSERATKRVDAGRKLLIDRGWRCHWEAELDISAHFDTIQQWGKGKAIVYFRYDHSTGGWGIMAELTDSIEIDKTTKALEAFDAQANYDPTTRVGHGAKAFDGSTPIVSDVAGQHERGAGA